MIKYRGLTLGFRCGIIPLRSIPHLYRNTKMRNRNDVDYNGDRDSFNYRNPETVETGCPDCGHLDGKHWVECPKRECDHEWDMDSKSCIFGCNTVIDEDTGFCPVCGDHSSNLVVCLKCDHEGEVDNWTREVTPY